MSLKIETTSYTEVRRKALKMAEEGQFKNWFAIRDAFTQVLNRDAINQIFASVPFQKQLDRRCLEAHR